MKIQDVIRNKGTEVVTIPPTSLVETLVALLHERNIGAVVVSTDGRHIEGIISERDVIHALATDGVGVLAKPVSELMTARVYTVSPDDGIEETAHAMTYQRIRHVPVVVSGEMHAIVSIGDVVKWRIDQLTDERNHLLGYLHA
ncbi:CBS domain-containing protein [Propionicicella superfundia]|uniref:CBS domain-containing protein n=1 Tax=Propionicicella superfundia TaxID=348582 RepID=UPI0004917D15|nr:CBS domain-containing protein [Propionicicella superfundia]